MLPQTGIKITREVNLNELRPADGYRQEIVTVFCGLARVGDITGTNYDRFFPEGERNKQRFIVYLPTQVAQEGDIVEFNLCDIGNNTAFSTSTSTIKARVITPPKTSTLRTRGVRQELYCTSQN